MEQAFDAAREGYHEGKFGFLDMLDAQRGLFEARTRLVDALASYHAARVEVERMTGVSVEQLGSSDS
jgi:cobalt-zinc-cadmium efflux system outer membrane protein